MPIPPSLRMGVASAVAAGGLVLVALPPQPASAQNTTDSSTSTTELDVGGGTAPSTTALPTGVEAGGGGTARDQAPLLFVALAGSAAAVVGVSAERTRRQRRPNLTGAGRAAGRTLR